MSKQLTQLAACSFRQFSGKKSLNWNKNNGEGKRIISLNMAMDGI